ncbi:LrgB family protein [Riemerella columbina]|uniref:LrgB family protein n=1 Tax=Riemerella columbina TaxID=103810 RepID=UPI00266F9CBE|nr:LrgB family protein [Riemerella columbina]WKS94812.1 LrgB family protein [Riemerella columbina]
MQVFLQNPYWLLGLTFLFYYSAILLQNKWPTPWLNPILMAALVMIGYLSIFNITFAQYEEAGKYIDFFLKPSVVALGVPLYLQLEKIKKQWIPVLVSHFFGSLVGIISVCGIAKLLGADREIILSLAPKSVTTPIAIEVSKTLGGLVPLTVSAVIITGLVGSVIGFQVLKWTRVKSPMAQGISLGASSHGMGIMMSMTLGERYAGFASVGLILNGVFTAIMAPYVVQWLF